MTVERAQMLEEQNMEQVIPSEIKDTGFTDRAIGIASVAFRKTFGI